MTPTPSEAPATKELVAEARRLWSEAWGDKAEWMQMSDPSAYYAAGQAESRFNLWCHENIPALAAALEDAQQTLARVREWAILGPAHGCVGPDEYITGFKEAMAEVAALLDNPAPAE